MPIKSLTIFITLFLSLSLWASDTCLDKAKYFEYNRAIIAFQQMDGEIFLNRGKEKFIMDGKFKLFEEAKKLDHRHSGVMNEGLWRGNFDGQSYIIKGVDDDSAMYEVRNSNIIAALKMGPATSLVQYHGKYFIVLEEVPGINIKDLLYPEDFSHSLSDKVLGIKSLEPNDSYRAYIGAILEDEELLAEMRNKAKILTELNLFDSDFQFMIKPATKDSPGSFNIIDTTFLERANPLFRFFDNPSKQIEYMIRQLKRRYKKAAQH